MKLIAITQRVSTELDCGERRDTLDQRWASFLHICGFTPYPIPNKFELLSSILSLPFHGIILTGGNTLHRDAPERDGVEKALLEYALAHALPLLGVCRGMQLILSYFGSPLKEVIGHITSTHDILLNGKETHVNSYHHYGAFEVHPPLKIIGQAKDGVVEAVKHEHLPIQGIMWHPERNSPFTASDKKLLHDMFQNCKPYRKKPIS